jgi:hypothetical protein
MRATPRGSDPERRQKISTAQGKEDANGSVIIHTCSGERVIVDEATISSCKRAFSGGGEIADEVAIGSCGCTLSGRGLIANEVTIGSCREGLTVDEVTVGSCRS